MSVAAVVATSTTTTTLVKIVCKISVENFCGERSASSSSRWQFHKLSSIWIQLWWWWRWCYCCWQSCSMELKVRASFLIHSVFSLKFEKDTKIETNHNQTNNNKTNKNTLRDDIEKRRKKKNYEMMMIKSPHRKY